MNGRADKDIIDIKKANLIAYLNKDDEYYEKISRAYNQNFISRFKSLLSDAVHVLHQEYLKRSNY